MNNVVIENILKTEKQAEEILNEARTNASKTLSEVEVKATKLKNKAVDEAKENLKKGKALEDDKAYEVYQSSLKTYEEDAKKVKENANKSMDLAVKVLVDKILK